MAAPKGLSGMTGNYPGSGVGVSGSAFAQADARPMPQSLNQHGAQDGPSANELREAWQAYDGRFGDANGPLANQSGVPNLNVRPNRIKPIVNTGVNFLFGPTLPIQVTDAKADEHADRPGRKTNVDVSKAADQAQTLLDATFGDDDQRMTLFSKMGVNGGVYGHVFVKVVEPRRGAPSATNPPRLALLNPENMSIETDPEDADLVLRYRIEYATKNAEGQPVRRRQEITRVDPDQNDATIATGMDNDTTWFVQNFEASGMTGGKFKPIDAGHVWPYALPPIVDFQNFPNPNAHWGQPDVTGGLVDLNQQLRLVESNINKIGFLQGHPFLYSVGADTGGQKPTPGGVLDLGAPDAKIVAVDASGDLAQLMEFAEQIRSDMDEESGVPGVATGRMQGMPTGQISGITIRLLHSSILARTEHKRRLYGQGIRQLCQTILCVCGVALDTVQNLAIQLNWQDPLPTDDLANAQTAVALQGIGYSQHTLIERTDGDPDVEAQWKAEEQQAQMQAVYHGTGLPPAPGAPQAPMPADGGPSLGSATAGAPAADDGSQPQGKQKPGRSNVNPNNPAAVVARQKVKAAFGKA